MPQSAKAYSLKLYDAIELAARAHRCQVRKGTEIPYIVHPLAVAGILIHANCPEHLVIAGILHDTLEDTPLTLEEIRSQFGREVADLVVALSEPDKKAPWEERKAHTIDHLEQKATPDVLLVSVADKLDNMRAIRDGLESARRGVLAALQPAARRPEVVLSAPGRRVRTPHHGRCGRCTGSRL